MPVTVVTAESKFPDCVAQKFDMDAEEAEEIER